MSDTPRTDVAIIFAPTKWKWKDGELAREVVLVDFARQLERELNLAIYGYEQVLEDLEDARAALRLIAEALPVQWSRTLTDDEIRVFSRAVQEAGVPVLRKIGRVEK